MLSYTHTALIHAKQLRQQQTDAEQFLWLRLRNRRLAGLKFRRQVPIGSYIVDFYCHDCALVVELDGAQHLAQVEYDAVRTAFLQAQGLSVLRFWNHEVLQQLDSVLEQILQMAST